MQEEYFCCKGVNITPGIFAENITTEGIDLRKLVVGDRLKINKAIIEISEIGKKCHHRCEIYKKVGKCLMLKEGIFGKMIKGGRVRKGDVVEVIPKVDTAILTISDSCSCSIREDKSGKYLKDIYCKYNWNVLKYEIIPDEKETIKNKLREFSDMCDLILTTGGTGITKRDITPEATQEVIDKEVPGIS